MFTYSVGIDRSYELPKMLLSTKNMLNAVKTCRILWDHGAKGLIEVSMGSFHLCTLYKNKHVEIFMAQYYETM